MRMSERLAVGLREAEVGAELGEPGAPSASVVPTGEVDSSTTRLPGFSTGAIERLAAAT